MYNKYKNKKYKIDNDNLASILNEQRFYLTESDFYPPPDERILKSYIDDIDGGDNFTDYCCYFFEVLDEEEYYD